MLAHASGRTLRGHGVTSVVFLLILMMRKHQETHRWMLYKLTGQCSLTVSRPRRPRGDRGAAPDADQEMRGLSTGGLRGRILAREEDI